jgi:uncharacterized protein YggT (Ycf19 family)
MGLFITDGVGLIIAFLNTVTFILLVYMLLQVLEQPRSKVYRALDRVFRPVLWPLRRILPIRRFDVSPLLAAAVLQVLAFFVRKNWL